jgi:hypothetical protein
MTGSHLGDFFLGDGLRFADIFIEPLAVAQHRQQQRKLNQRRNERRKLVEVKHDQIDRRQRQQQPEIAKANSQLLPATRAMIRSFSDWRAFSSNSARAARAACRYCTAEDRARNPMLRCAVSPRPGSRA